MGGLSMSSFIRSAGAVAAAGAALTAAPTSPAELDPGAEKELVGSKLDTPAPVGAVVFAKPVIRQHG